GSEHGRLVEQVEEARERPERPLVRLRLAEESQHRLGADQADVETVRLLARGVVRPQQVDAGHRLEVARSLVEQQLDVRQRLEPPAETGFRLAGALRDRADATATGRVEMEDPAGLREPQRAEADGLRCAGPPA